LSRDSVVGMTRLPAGRFTIRITGGLSELSETSRPALWPLWFLFSKYWGSSPRVRRPWHEFNHWPPSSAEVKYGWSYDRTPCICLHNVDRENFIVVVVVLQQFCCDYCNSSLRALHRLRQVWGTARQLCYREPPFSLCPLRSCAQRRLPASK